MGTCDFAKHWFVKLPTYCAPVRATMHQVSGVELSPKANLDEAVSIWFCIFNVKQPLFTAHHSFFLLVSFSLKKDKQF